MSMRKFDGIKCFNIVEMKLCIGIDLLLSGVLR